MSAKSKSEKHTNTTDLGVMRKSWLAPPVASFGLPCTPSKKIEEERYDAKAVKLTYGGGMGGGNESFYIKEKQIEYDAHGIAKVTKFFTGAVIEINVKYVVHSHDINLLFVKFDTTAHRNEGEYSYKEIIQIYEIPTNAVVEFIDNYHGDVRNSNATLISTQEIKKR